MIVHVMFVCSIFYNIWALGYIYITGSLDTCHSLVLYFWGSDCLMDQLNLARE